MRAVITITITALLLLLAVKCAQVSIDRITMRDCERGIAVACEEVTRLNLKK